MKLTSQKLNIILFFCQFNIMFSCTDDPDSLPSIDLTQRQVKQPKVQQDDELNVGNDYNDGHIKENLNFLLESKNKLAVDNNTPENLFQAEEPNIETDCKKDFNFGNNQETDLSIKTDTKEKLNSNDDQKKYTNLNKENKEEVVNDVKIHEEYKEKFKDTKHKIESIHNSDNTVQNDNKDNIEDIKNKVEERDTNNPTCKEDIVKKLNNSKDQNVQNLESLEKENKIQELKTNINILISELSDNNNNNIDYHKLFLNYCGLLTKSLKEDLQKYVNVVSYLYNKNYLEFYLKFLENKNNKNTDNENTDNENTDNENTDKIINIKEQIPLYENAINTIINSPSFFSSQEEELYITGEIKMLFDFIENPILLKKYLEACYHDVEEKNITTEEILKNVYIYNNYNWISRRYKACSKPENMTLFINEIQKEKTLDNLNHRYKKSKHTKKDIDELIEYLKKYNSKKIAIDYNLLYTDFVEYLIKKMEKHSNLFKEEIKNIKKGSCSNEEKQVIEYMIFTQEQQLKILEIRLNIWNKYKHWKENNDILYLEYLTNEEFLDQVNQLYTINEQRKQYKEQLKIRNKNFEQYFEQYYEKISKEIKMDYYIKTNRIFEIMCKMNDSRTEVFKYLNNYFLTLPLEDQTNYLGELRIESK